jgi:hypothetical protein
VPTYRCNHCSAEWSIPLNVDKGIARKLVGVSKRRQLDSELIKQVSQAFDLEMIPTMSLIKHSIKGNHCVSCAAPLSDLGRFTRHCIVCGGMNFDWRAVATDR